MNNLLPPHELVKMHSDNGLIPVETVPMLPGASSPAQNAVLYREQQIAKQQSMNNGHSGGKKKGSRRRSFMRRNHRSYFGGNIQVPSFTQPGAPVSSGNQTPTGASMSANSSALSVQANAVCDGCIGAESLKNPICQGPQCNPIASSQSGGNCVGGNQGLIPDGQTWNCMSGGIKKARKSKKTKKSKKAKKSRKATRSKKAKKSKKTKKSKKA